MNVEIYLFLKKNILWRAISYEEISLFFDDIYSITV